MHGGPRDTQTPRGFTLGQASDGREPFWIDPAPGSTEPRVAIPAEALQRVEGLSADIAAVRLGVSRSTIKRWRRQVQESLSV